MKVTNKILKTLGWALLIFWGTAFIIAIVYKDDPVVRGSVRAISVSIAGIFTDTRELQKQIMEDTKKELKK